MSRIAFLTSRPMFNTGGNIYLMNVIDGLVKHGHEVELHTIATDLLAGKKYGLLEIPPGIDIIYMSKLKRIAKARWYETFKGGMKIWEMAFTLKKLNKFDYVVFCDDIAFSVIPLARKYGTKTIALIHHLRERNFGQYADCVVNGENPSLFWLRKIGCGFLGGVDYVVAVSSYWKEKLQKERCARAKSIYVIQNGIDPNFFNEHSDISTFKRKYGLENRFVIMTGVFDEGRGIETILDVVEEMSRATLLVTGRWTLNNKWEKKIISRIKRLEKERKFIWTGILPWNEYKSAILASDAVALLSLYEEGWGRILHEGALAGKPLITTGLGGMKEIAESTSSWIIEPGDLVELKATIENINNLTDKELEKIRERNYQWATKYTWENTIKKWNILVTN